MKVHGMRLGSRVVLLILAPCMSCAVEESREPSNAVEVERTSVPRSIDVDKSTILFDIEQRTCALYVALHSGSLESAVAFGRTMDDSMVHWNKCPGGTMVACAKVPSTDGDTVLVGIPWAHHMASDL